MGFAYIRLLCGLSLCAVLAGCGGVEKDLPQTVPVSGVVTYNGKVVEGAQVAFQPAERGSGLNKLRPARGITDAKGKFTLKTFAGGSDNVTGVMPGKYNVSVTKRVREAGADEMTLEEQLATMRPGDQMKTPKNELPEKYANATKSGLTATVSADGAKDLKFELAD